MNPIFLQIGPISIYWYSIILLFAFLIGAILVLKETKKFNIDSDEMYNLFFYLIPTVLIGARLYFVLFHFDYYANDLLGIFKIWEGGLAIHGGIIAGFIFLILYTRKHHQSLFKMIDIFAISLILGQAIGRWGNFFNGEAHGPITTIENLQTLHIPEFIIKGMYIQGNYYQPTFFYESIWCLIGFIILLFVRKLKNIKIGQITSIYLIWYGIGRFFIESMRTDSLMLLNFKIAQVVSILSILCGIILFFTSIKKQNYHKGGQYE